MNEAMYPPFVYFFGLPAAGKNYAGGVMAKEFGYTFYDGDLDLTLEMRDAMREVVRAGSATRLQIEGFDVGAKTGTAQFGNAPLKSHAWVIAWAGPPGQAPTVAVAVLVEAQAGVSEQTGGRVAAPIAKQVIEAAMAPLPAAPPAGADDTTSTTGG